jgi:hypothetical protein
LRPGARARFRIYMLMERLSLWTYARANELWFPDETRFRWLARNAVRLASLLPAEGP